MGYRTFVDNMGSYWQVWDVRPDRIERRTMERRKLPAQIYIGIERRRAQRRGFDQRRVVVSEGLQSGWLVFESQTEKRRFSPIPKDWEKASEAQLRFVCEKAQPVTNGTNGHTSVA